MLARLVPAWHSVDTYISVPSREMCPLVTQGDSHVPESKWNIIVTNQKKRFLLIIDLIWLKGIAYQKDKKDYITVKDQKWLLILF